MLSSMFPLAVDVLYLFNNATGMSNVDGEFLPSKFIEKGIPYFGKIYHVLQVRSLLYKQKLIVSTNSQNKSIIIGNRWMADINFYISESLLRQANGKYLIKYDQNVEIYQVFWRVKIICNFLVFWGGCKHSVILLFGLLVMSALGFKARVDPFSCVLCPAWQCILHFHVWERDLQIFTCCYLLFLYIPGFYKWIHNVEWVACWKQDKFCSTVERRLQTSSTYVVSILDKSGFVWWQSRNGCHRCNAFSWCET